MEGYAVACPFAPDIPSVRYIRVAEQELMKMVNVEIRQVKENTASGQKIVYVPKESSMGAGAYVKISPFDGENPWIVTNVRENISSRQKYIYLPKDFNIKVGDYVKVEEINV
jgi:hypothetical protein